MVDVPHNTPQSEGPGGQKINPDLSKNLEDPHPPLASAFFGGFNLKKYVLEYFFKFKEEKPHSDTKEPVRFTPSLHVDLITPTSDPYSHIKPQHMGLLIKIKSAAQSEAFERAFETSLRHAGKQPNPILIHFEILSRYPSPIRDNILEMLGNAIKTGLISRNVSLGDNHLPDITAQVLINAYLRTDIEQRREAIKNDYLKFANADKIHYSSLDPRRARAFAETLDIYLRGMSYRHAFSTLKFAAQRNYRKDPSELVQFGHDSSYRTFIINATDQNGMPGRGVKYSGLILERLFATDRSALDPFWRQKEAAPHLAKDLNAVRATEFFFTRGLWAVMSEKDDALDLRIKVKGRNVNYSLLIYNDHFSGAIPQHAGSETFYLVPSPVLKPKFLGTLINAADFKGYGLARHDVNNQELDIYSISREANSLGLPVLHLGSGSNFAGGLTNAWEPGAKWFFPDEFSIRSKGGIFVDVWNHTHKGDITGRYPGRGEVTSSWLKAMNDFAKAHDEVYRIATSLFNRLEIFFMAYGEWTKGLTIGDAPRADYPLGQHSGESEQYLSGGDAEQAESMPDWELPTLDHEEQYFAAEADPHQLHINPNSYRALSSAYHWHQSGKEAGILDKDKYPIFAFAPARSLWSIPKSPIYLDTFDMKLRVGETAFYLPPRTIEALPAEAVELWREFALPHFHSDLALRPFHRKDLKILEMLE